MKWREVISQCLREDTGKWSFARISTAIWLAGCITWTSFYLTSTHHMPDGPMFFGMGSVIGSLYSVNKIGTMIAKNGIKHDDPDEEHDNPDPTDDHEHHHPYL